MRKYWLFLIFFVFLSILIKIFGEDNPINVYLFELINYHQLSYLNAFMVDLSKYGRCYVWIPLNALLLIFKKTRRTGITLAASFILAIILGEASKYIMAEPRPFYFIHSNLLIPKPHDYSYPSGHALIVGDGAAVLALSSPKWLWIPLLIEALLVSYSRVYVGVHWPADILGGWLLALWIAYFTVEEERKGLLTPVEKIFKVC
ncbi:MAG: phosphatase PAP2 family protein [Acidianus hospitalis]